MPANHRRKFLRQSSLIGIAGFAPSYVFSLPVSPAEKRKFKMCLNPGAIGVKTNQKALLTLAEKFGFEAIVAMPDEIANMSEKQLSDFLDTMQAKQISWGSAGLPMDFRKDEKSFRDGLARLPRLAGALQQAGVSRLGTWIMPTHVELTYLANFRQHASRLREIAKVLGHYGLRLGLEYVGPKTLMTRDKYAFIRSMQEAKELIFEIGESNVGLVLDSFHWFCAGETVADILTLRKEDIVTCDLNDARAGFTADEQIDNKRELPVATGVINLKAFLGALISLGYDGPVRAEPFNQKLNDMDNEVAVKTTYGAMKKAFDLI